MRHITKGESDYFLSQKNKKKPHTADSATKAWSRFKYKDATAKRCLSEQFFLCCYTEICLNNLFPIMGSEGVVVSTDYGYHLEHIEPKSLNPQKTFEHNNLIISAISSSNLHLLSKKDVFGGHAKLSNYSASSFISPLMASSQDYFHYEATGKVVPKESLNNNREKAKARLTIYLLNLNAPVLVHWRKIWISALSKIIDENDSDVIKQVAELELSPIGKSLRPFHTAQRQLFGKLGDDICTKINI
ncbi:TIGR02646 family protein [Raoultella terrigena]|uniref:retron system putative HNH endonuclease n=1 Tax=Raoultella terrigena TaxID=577 RepID=UPI002DB955B6|nr:retron system putative HNH endonuclease [Raoultella terrigena]MEB8192422.1 TIGR02646 family protein [Raoultella terrigena]